jgi:hypothetical protein
VPTTSQICKQGNNFHKSLVSARALQKTGAAVAINEQFMARAVWSNATKDLSLPY